MRKTPEDVYRASLWFENEYVITPAATYIYLGNAARALLEE